MMTVKTETIFYEKILIVVFIQSKIYVTSELLILSKKCVTGELYFVSYQTQLDLLAVFM